MDVLIETSEQRRQVSGDRVVRICRRCIIRGEPEGVIQIPVHRQGLAVIVVRYSKTAAQDRLTTIPKEGVEQAAGIIWRPCKRYARLEVVLIPVVHWLPAVGLAGARNTQR